MKDIKKIFIIRGCPGSGKTTFAKSLGVAHFEADMFHIDEYGIYKWNPNNLKESHEWCKMKVENVMILGEDVAVSNTFTQEWEMKPYYELAEKYGYIVFSIIVENRHGGINEHDVPSDKVEQMKNRFEIKLI
jgi:adenylate kinase family enzyme